MTRGRPSRLNPSGPSHATVPPVSVVSARSKAPCGNESGRNGTSAPGRIRSIRSPRSVSHLVAGAAVTLALGADGWTLAAAIAGMAATLGTLGLAIVVNGLRGKRSGGASGLAVLVTVALVFASVLAWVSGPVIQNRSLNWSPSYSAGDTSQRTVINGNAALDLTDYFRLRVR